MKYLLIQLSTTIAAVLYHIRMMTAPTILQHISNVEKKSWKNEVKVYLRSKLLSAPNITYLGIL